MTKTIIVPENWKDIYYKDYIKFVNSIKEEEDEKYIAEMALQYLCNLNVEDYYALDKETFDMVTTSVAEVLNNQSKQPLIKTLTVNGIEYGIDPNLENMSYGQYLDLTTYSKDMWNNIPIICSILYRPITNKFKDVYQIEKYTGTKDEVVQLFRETLTMDVVNGVVAFFLNLQKDLLIHSPISLLKNLKKDLTIQQQETLLRSGVDIKRLSQLLEETLPNLMK